MHHVQGIELEVVTLIEPGADKVIEPQACSSRECQGIDHELGNGLVSDRVRLVVEDMDPTALSSSSREQGNTEKKPKTRLWSGCKAEGRLVVCVTSCVFPRSAECSSE
jgi:hypothetical protein